MPAERTIDDPEAARLLLDERGRRYLGPFLGQACGISEAARQLGVGRSGVSYWVGRLHRAGLLAPVEAEGRRAWCSTAGAFVVALRDLPLDSDVEVLAAYMDGAFARTKQALLRIARQQADDWQLRVQLTPQGVLQTIAPRSGDLLQAQLVNHRGNLWLSHQQAEAMRAELVALVSRYSAMSVRGPGRRLHRVWACAVEDLPD